MPQLQSPRLGYQDNPQLQALSNVLQAIQGQSGQPTTWGFHEPTVDVGAGVEAGMSKFGEVMSDPRNAWVGLGPLAMMSRPAGWGAEVLRRYKLLGGTPETLKHTLGQRGIERNVKDNIVQAFKYGTDIAAPSARDGEGIQLHAMKKAGEMFEEAGGGLRDNSGFVNFLGNAQVPQMESAARGNAAYDAVSRQVGRMLNSPGFKFSKAQDLPDVGDTGYFKDLPIHDPGRMRRSSFADPLWNDSRYPRELLQQEVDRANRWNTGRVFQGTRGLNATNIDEVVTPAMRERIRRELGVQGSDARPNERRSSPRRGSSQEGSTSSRYGSGSRLTPEEWQERWRQEEATLNLPPITREQLDQLSRSRLTQAQIDEIRRRAGSHTSGQRGEATSRGERYNYDTQRWEPDDRQ